MYVCVKKIDSVLFYFYETGRMDLIPHKMNPVQIHTGTVTEQ